MSADELIAIVEVPKGSRNKYEYDPDYGGIKLDRFVSASVVYPADYGYFPDTLAPDGDELDALVCVSEPTFPGCIVPVKPIALFRMSDEKGDDDTVVCVPHEDPGWTGLEQLDDLCRRLTRGAAATRSSSAAWSCCSRRCAGGRAWPYRAPAKRPPA